MHEILTHLDGGYVLDLGSRFGSFEPRGRLFVTVRVDLDPPAEGGGARVVKADSARLPFRDGCFAAVISNHSLEHFEQLEEALGEVGRVTGPGRPSTRPFLMPLRLPIGCIGGWPEAADMSMRFARPRLWQT